MSERCATGFVLKNSQLRFWSIPLFHTTSKSEFFRRQNLWHIIHTFETGILQNNLFGYILQITQRQTFFCLFNGRHIFWLNCKLYTTLTLTRKFGLYSENLPSALSLFLCLRKSLLCKLLSHWAAQLPKKNLFLARSDTTKLIFEDKIWLLP